MRRKATDLFMNNFISPILSKISKRDRIKPEPAGKDMIGMRSPSSNATISEDVYRGIRNVKYKIISNIPFYQMFITAVCVLFLVKLRRPRKKSI